MDAAGPDVDSALTVRAQVQEGLVDPVLLGGLLHQHFMVGGRLLETFELLGTHARGQRLLEVDDGAADVAAAAVVQSRVLGQRRQRTGRLEAGDVVVECARQPQVLIGEQLLVVRRLHEALLHRENCDVAVAAIEAAAA